MTRCPDLWGKTCAAPAVPGCDCDFCRWIRDVRKSKTGPDPNLLKKAFRQSTDPPPVRVIDDDGFLIPAVGLRERLEHDA